MIAAVITVSDRSFAGTRPDTSGPLAAKLLSDAGCEVAPVMVVPDETSHIVTAIDDALAAGARLILTTGGTGIGPRDVTPEATATRIEARLDGLAAQIRERGLAVSPHAVLSRGLVGITGRGRNAAVIVNAPGSVGGTRDACAVITPVIHHLVEQLDGSDH